MRTVSTKEELERGLKEGEVEFQAIGTLAETIISNQKKKKYIKYGVIGLAAVGVALALPTGGATLGLTAGAVALSTTELLILCGFGLGSIFMFGKLFDSVETEVDPKTKKVKLKFKSKKAQ